MNDFLKKYSALLSDPSGLESIDAEMTRTNADIAETLQSQQPIAAEIAAAIKENSNVLLLGMGASQFVNDIFAYQLRKNGICARAMTASEFIYDPIPTEGTVVILTSQSGESVETVKCLPLIHSPYLFGVTLTPGTTIAEKTRSLICAGGSEEAYAGTRSVTLSLAGMALISAELGQISKDEILKAVEWERKDYTCMDEAVWLLFNRSTMVVTGRSLFSPLAGLFGLGAEELGNYAVLYNETGTFRHGPMEILDSHCAVVVFRQNGFLGELCASFEDVKKKTGSALICVDASGMKPLEGAVTIPCPEGDDILAALGIMTTFQELMIAYACGRNPRAGLPRYGSKVTTTE